MAGRNAATERIQKELHDLMKNPMTYCSAGPVEENLMHWHASIVGPSESPYAGGCFQVDIRFPSTYPFKPPKCRFLTKVYHCNVSRTGNICLDILKGEWSPVLTIGKVLLSILSLLTDPEPSDPLTPEIANLYLRDRAQHDMNAREWTLAYATGGFEQNEQNEGKEH